MDIYKQEEKVRQWLLHELIDSYGYPLKNIEIEYMLKIGSSTRFADIAVFSSKEGFREPYMLVEIKREGALVESDKKQLESYCAVTPSIQFSILTDGKTINIYDREFNLLDDIPCFKEAEELSCRLYNYLAVKEGYDCRLSSYDFEKRVDVLEGEQIWSLINDDLSTVPVVGKISAGYGSYTIENFTGEFQLPKKWSTNSFLLEVKGDSMIDADINDGDLALIKKGISPLNGDIIACAISNEECTLKRFQKKSDQIILIPENKDYERIYLNPEDESIRVIGVLSGIIKYI